MTRQARRPASERTLDPGAPLLFRPIAGDAPEVTTTGVPSPAQVAAPLHGRQDLRRSYASRALALGESLTMIGKLLGHTQVQTTARYAHLARDSIQNAAARITGSIGGNLAPSNQRAAHDVSE